MEKMTKKQIVEKGINAFNELMQENVLDWCTGKAECAETEHLIECVYRVLHLAKELVVDV